MFTKFPKIGQFRDVINHVKQKTRFVGLDDAGEALFDATLPLPKMVFKGTVKLHGTNAAISRNSDGSIHFQSRERIITPNNDNAGFATWASTIDWRQFLAAFAEFDQVVIFGEWCGGNIQQGVAINQLPKMFVIFKALADGIWFTPTDLCLPEKQIFNIRHFPTFEVEIDFEHPEHVQNHLIEITEAVEAECPVGKAFGVSGIGEGVVWTSVTDRSLIFKVKGDKHSSTKTKRLASVDMELVGNIEEFIENTVTENRLNQGLEHVTLDMKSTGDFIRWVFNDILTEEADVIVASGLEPKNIGKYVSVKAKKFFFERIKNA
jgi:hypothetical protein